MYRNQTCESLHIHTSYKNQERCTETKPVKVYISILHVRIKRDVQKPTCESLHIHTSYKNQERCTETKPVKVYISILHIRIKRDVQKPNL